jgi:hypothetical protein
MTDAAQHATVSDRKCFVGMADSLPALLTSARLISLTLFPSLSGEAVVVRGTLKYDAASMLSCLTTAGVLAAAMLG